MRIIIFTDSLGRPRPDISDKEKTEYEDVYGYKLKKYFDKIHDVELIYIESLDTEDAIHWSQRMVAFRKPDMVIYHIGINDCAPRLFKKNTRNIVFNSFFRKFTFDFFLKLISYFRYQFTKLKPLVYVSKFKFENNLKIMFNDVLKYNSNCKFLMISISKSKELDKKSYNYNKNIQDYNELLYAVSDGNYIEINDIIKDNGLISDSVHLSKKSHELLFKEIKSKIEDK